MHLRLSRERGAMRTLLALSVFQALLLALIGLRVLAVDSRTDELSEKIASISAGAPAPGPSRTAAFSEAPAQAGPGADEIRQIIREEIAALSPQDGEPAPARRAEPAPRNYSSADVQFMKEQIRQDIADYSRQGSMGEAEMADLQLKIARLPPDERKEMMSQLVRAVNSGELDARF